MSAQHVPDGKAAEYAVVCDHCGTSAPALDALNREMSGSGAWYRVFVGLGPLGGPNEMAEHRLYRFCSRACLGHWAKALEADPVGGRHFHVYPPAEAE